MGVNLSFPFPFEDERKIFSLFSFFARLVEGDVLEETEESEDVRLMGTWDEGLFGVVSADEMSTISRLGLTKGAGLALPNPGVENVTSEGGVRFFRTRQPLVSSLILK